MIEVDGWKVVTFWIYLKVDPRGFTYGLGMGCARKWGVKDDSGFETGSSKNESTAENTFKAGARQGTLLSVAILTFGVLCYINWKQT